MYRYNTGEESDYVVRPLNAKARSTFAARLFDLVTASLERARQRRHLAELDDRMLRDIGISRSEVDGEVSRRFWRA